MQGFEGARLIGLRAHKVGLVGFGRFVGLGGLGFAVFRVEDPLHIPLRPPP